MCQIGEREISRFAQQLRQEERAPGTVENYLRHLRAFAAWSKGEDVTKALAAAWKDHLLRCGYAPASVNAMLVPLNRLFDFLGWGECKVRQLRVQRRLFRENSRELTRGEYARLLASARSQGRERLALLMEAICVTGIRVSEARYLTVEAVGAGKVEISLKGKIRAILIPKGLRKKLLGFAKKENTASGAIFHTRSGNPISRKQIWAEMKSLCEAARVEASKVFPHNLRHLFARAFFQVCHNIVQLADVLGHSSIETTRLYLVSTGEEHQRQLERTGLLL